MSWSRKGDPLKSSLKTTKIECSLVSVEKFPIMYSMSKFKYIKIQRGCLSRILDFFDIDWTEHLSTEITLYSPQFCSPFGLHPLPLCTFLFSLITICDSDLIVYFAYLCETKRRAPTITEEISHIVLNL